ncbi:alanine racemase [Pseudomarimonas salicorniae]|uniref:Alanine racemase n=1 Tax=Pseudomarimonas salicorniae TaxID=2933270 RepID=A0ABT0GD56_9GAMM|nr:alanine racemase [Lysobacter sp. CAU 1642]MCK7592471.1 alanine racemase [Lysobacter sp. CAU 1642]
MSRPASATIHTDALQHNLAEVRRRAPGSRVMAVVKADGYGHGLERVAQALAGADAFGVASIADAERIRATGSSKRIVLLSGFFEPADLSLIRRLQLDTVVHHETQLAMIEADRDPAPLRLWVKFDSGMHRLGFDLADAERVAERIRALPQCAEAPVWMTHFARSDEFEAAATADQVARFDAALECLGGARSLSNSAAVLGWPAAHRDWVRAGGALYGLSVVAGKTGADFGLRPAMSLTSRLVAVNHVPEGEAIGYGGVYVARRPLRVGIVALGYGDGYPRVAPSGTPVLVGGQRAPTVGRVSMDLMAIDLSHLPAAQVGDPVTLWGPDLPVEHIAEAAGTISYELTCGITRRVRFVED